MNCAKNRNKAWWHGIMIDNCETMLKKLQIKSELTYTTNIPFLFFKKQMIKTLVADWFHLAGCKETLPLVKTAKLVYRYSLSLIRLLQINPYKLCCYRLNHVPSTHQKWTEYDVDNQLHENIRQTRVCLQEPDTTSSSQHGFWFRPPRSQSLAQAFVG